MIKDKAAFKSQLLESCRLSLEMRIDQLSNDMRAIQDSANEETKSSAGDKYETGRSMAMMEKEKLASQYTNAEKQLNQILQIKNTSKSKVEQGCIVFTGNAIYFLSASLGQMKLNTENVFCISPAAPIAQAMLGKSIGDSFSWNGNTFEIKDLF